MYIASSNSERTPLIANLMPGGVYYAQDVHRLGGMRVIIQELLSGGFLHGQTPTLTGQTLAESVAGAPEPDGEVMFPVSNPISDTGSRVPAVVYVSWFIEFIGGSNENEK